MSIDPLKNSFLYTTLFSSLNAPFAIRWFFIREFSLNFNKYERGQKQMRPETREGKGNVMKGGPLAPA